jgi:heat shock protein HslJ
MKTPGMTRRSRPALALVGALVLASCSDEVTGPSDLEGGAWRLETMELSGGSAFEPEDPGRFTIQFNTDGTVGVQADCNQCGGSYNLSGDTLTVGPLICTLIACPTPRGQEFASIIDGTTSIDVDDDEIEIESSEGTLVLTR